VNRADEGKRSGPHRIARPPSLSGRATALASRRRANAGTTFLGWFAIDPPYLALTLTRLAADLERDRAAALAEIDKGDTM
jgi:hypothetical protein